MKVSILIPTLATPKSLPYLRACIDSIRRNSTEQHDILVMVNGENFPTLSKIGASVFYIREQGQCKAVNALVKEVKTEYMVVTDDDSMFPPGWEKMLENLAEHPVVCMNSMESGRIGAAPPFVVNDCGQDLNNFNKEKFEADAVKLGEAELDQANWSELRKKYAVEGSLFLEHGFSFPFALKKETWLKVEGYDEKYDPWSSNCDSDLHYKFRLAGMKPVRDRRVLNYHFSQISGTFEPAQNAFWQRNRSFFEQKWGFRRADSPEIWYSFDIPYGSLTYRPSWANLPTV